jgi:hypothetical protein
LSTSKNHDMELLLIIIRLAFAIAILAGVAKCWELIRRPGTNSKCIASLMLLLIAWLVAFAGVNLAAVIGEPGLVFMSGFVAFAIVMAGGALATMGLREYGRKRHGYTQGKAQGITALALSALLFLSMIGILAFGRYLFGGEAVGGQPLVFNEHNFSLLTPPGRWVKTETNMLDKTALLSYKRDRPEAYFILSIHNTGDPDYGTDRMVVYANDALGNVVDSVWQTYRGDAFVSGLGGITLHHEATARGDRLFFRHSLFATNGWTYKFVVWGKQRNKAELFEYSRMMCERFTVLDPQRFVNRTSGTTNAATSPSR